MGNQTEWAWLVETTQGEFFITAIGEWTQEEAAARLLAVFHVQLKQPIIRMNPRKVNTLDMDSAGTIEQDKDDTELDFKFFAGKKLWAVCGRAAEYDAQMILELKSLKE